MVSVRAARRRLEAVLGALEFASWAEMARELGLTREHFAALRGSEKSGVSKRLALAIFATFDVEMPWLLEGTGLVFKGGRFAERYKKTFRIMEGVIRDLERQGLGHDEGLAAFNAIEEIVATPPTIPVEQLSDLEPSKVFGVYHRNPIKWRAYYRRAAGLPGATVGDAFFMRLDEQTKRIFGGEAGDFALFAFTRWFVRRFPPAEGDSLVCVLEAKGKRRLARMVVSKIVSPEKGGDSRKKSRTTNTVVFRDGTDTEIIMSPVTKTRLAEKTTVLAAAIKVEHDVVSP